MDDDFVVNRKSGEEAEGRVVRHLDVKIRLKTTKATINTFFTAVGAAASVVMAIVMVIQMLAH